MRVPVWMIFGLLLVILIMDLTTIMVVRSRILSAAELALDAALVGGVNQEDVFVGRLFIDEAAGFDLAQSYFKKNMGLNENLENNFLKKTVFRIDFSQNADKPKVIAEISTIITAVSTKVLGLEGVPVTVRGTRYYVSKYK